jgi:sorbitol-specific phosphotransferase system component IIC
MKGGCVGRKQSVFISTLGAVVASFLVVFSAPISLAFSQTMEEGARSARGTDQVTDLFGTTGIFATVTNILLFVVGAISVIMIIIGGLRYVTSGGNTANVTAAKNTILYAIVGVVVSLFAYALINFVLTSFLPSVQGNSGTNV